MNGSTLIVCISMYISNFYVQNECSVCTYLAKGLWAVCVHELLMAENAETFSENEIKS